MALNPPLLPVYQPNSVPFPAPFAGEYICCSREQCHFKLDGPRNYKFSGGGTAFLTNYRLVFVAKKPAAGIHAMEFPLVFIDRINVQQPILGANYLHGECKPADSPPNTSEIIKWKLSFTNGGMGTFVRLVFAAVEYVKVMSRQQQQQQQQQPPPATPDLTPTKPPAFLETAFVDPNDPTKIYLTEPVDVSSQSPTEKPQYKVVS